jgi:hypothetical protein
VSRLAPDLALALALVTLLYCLFLYDGGRRLFRDSDTGWHIVTGQRILAGGGLPHTDPYSFSRPAGEWFAWEWASDVAFALAHRAAGLRGVAWLAAAAIALSTWLWVRWQWSLGGDFFLVCVSGSLVLSTANLHWLARPHVFSWPLLLTLALWTEQRRRTGFRPRAWLALAALAALWANLHASFLMAPLWLAAAALGCALNTALWGGEAKLARGYALSAAVALAATLSNPYGWRLHRHVAAYLCDSELLARVGEFQSFNFHLAGSAQVVAALLVAMAGVVLAAGARRLDQALLSCGLVWMALRSARGLPLMALLAVPIACGALTRWLETSAGWRAPVARWMAAALEYSRGLRRLDQRMHGLVPSLLAARALAALLPSAGFPPDEFPVAAAGKLPAAARLLAPDKYGGYLIYRFGGTRPVFFDGRSDYYGTEFLKRYLRMTELRPGWRREVASWNFTHALLPAASPLSAALTGDGWRELYRDRVAVVLKRPGPSR